MKKEIEWYVNDGCLGGLRGLSYDLETNTITKWNGEIESLSHNNIEDVRWVLKNKKDSLNIRLDNIRTRLKQTETVHIKIENGYKILEPLTEKQRNILESKMEEIYKELEFLNSIELRFKEFLNDDIYFTYSTLGQPFFLRNGDKDCSNGISSRDWKPNELRLIADYIEKNPNSVLFHDGSGK